MNATRKIISSAILLTLATAAGGCYQAVGTARSVSGATVATVALPKPSPTHVSVSSRWAYSAEENRPSIDWLLEAARQAPMLGGVKLNELVSRWPDVTLELLRDSVGRTTDVPLRMAIAETYDRIFETDQDSSGWSTALTMSASQHEIYDRFRESRDRAIALLQNGKLADARKADLAGMLPADAPAALRAEALRVSGLIALLDENPQRAAQLFENAVSLAEKGPRHVQFELRLYLSEAERRCDRADRASTAWRNAVAIAAAGSVHDPELWERAILAKPKATDWPPEAEIAGAGEPAFAGQSPDVGDVLIGIGKWRLNRGGFQQALLAFSQAEAETTSPGKKALARLYRVQSMIALQQPASALPMLESLAQFNDRRIVRRAEALRGDILCHVLNDRKNGIPAMREALRDPSVGAWPEKDRLMANLGLYDLLENNDDEGLVFLHQAQASFQARNQWEDLNAALKNEAAFLRVTGKSEEAELIQKHADDVARKAGLPTGPLT